MANINIIIPDDLHLKAKEKALKNKISLKELVIKSIEKEVK